MMIPRCVSCLAVLAATASAFSSSSHRPHFAAPSVSSSIAFQHRYYKSASPSPLSSALWAVKTDQEEEQSSTKINEKNPTALDINNDNPNGLTTITPTTTADIPQQKEQVMDDDDALSGWIWRGAVVVLCALWASNFPMAKLVMAEPGVDSSLYAVSRFGLAALALAPGAIATVRRVGMDAETIKAAFTCGGWVAFGYLGQTLGLLTTTASKSCVICSLHCVFVALVAEVWRVARVDDSNTTQFDVMRLVPALVAVAGVAIVELHGAAGGPTVGDLLSLAQPIGFGLGYLQLEELMAKRPDAALPVSAIKLFVVALASFAMFELSPLIQHGMQGLEMLSFRVPDFGAIVASPLALGGILYTGLITTALALWVESIAFRRVPATDASIILTTEPLIAAGIGAVTLGETFGMSDYLGAALIVGACAFAVFLDTPGDDDCDPDQDDNCEVPYKWPFFSN